MQVPALPGEGGADMRIMRGGHMCPPRFISTRLPVPRRHVP